MSDVCGAISIIQARSEEQIGSAVRLFRAYAAWLDLDLSFQGFESELQAMPGKYVPPAGELLLAEDEAGQALGVVGLRPMGPVGVCEMKRLYVLPSARGSGLGGRLIEAVTDTARRIGYREMKLDTLPSMTGAIALYEHHGFKRTNRYYDTPIEDTLFFSLSL